MILGKRYKTGEAAIHLGLKEGTLARWRVEGRGPRFRKQGSRVFYYQRDLDEWLDGCARTSTSGPRRPRHHDEHITQA